MKLVNKISELRSELVGLISQRTGMLQNTAEGIANDQRMHKIIELCCIELKSGNKFFSSSEHYSRFLQSNPDALSEILKQSYMFEYSIDTNITDDWAEIKFLKKLAEQEEKQEDKEPVAVAAGPAEEVAEVEAPKVKKRKKSD